MSLTPELLNQSHTPDSLQLPTGREGKREIILLTKPKPTQNQPHATRGSLVAVLEGTAALQEAAQGSEGHRFLGERKPRAADHPQEARPL